MKSSKKTMDIYRKVILALMGIFLIFLISLPLIAEINLNYARDLEDSFLWQDANLKYQLAVKYDPWNSRCIGAYADFLRTKGIYWKNRNNLLIKAEELYQRALGLNPYCAEYALNLGKVRMALGKTSEAIASFKRALSNDPNGVNIAYEFGYYCLWVWQKLNNPARELAISRLKFSLKYRPWCEKYLYPLAWKNTADFRILQEITPDNLKANFLLMEFLKNNNLYRFYEEQQEKVDFYRLKEDARAFEREVKERSARFARIKEGLRARMRVAAYRPEEAFMIQEKDWGGIAADGENRFKNGYMYWPGTMDAGIMIPPEAVKLVVSARGEPAKGIYPYMIVELDGEEAGEGYVDSLEWKDFSYDIPNNLRGEIRVVSIKFINDGFDIIKNEDRNLFVKEVRIE